MASQHIYTSALTSDVSVNGTQTLIQLVTPATRRNWVKGYQISGKSVSQTDVPILVYLVRQTTAGTSTGTLTPRPNSEGYPASLSTVNITFTVEPTEGDIVDGPHYVTPIGGNFKYDFSLGDEVEMAVSSRLALKVVTAQLTAIRAQLRHSE